MKKKYLLPFVLCIAFIGCSFEPDLVGKPFVLDETAKEIVPTLNKVRGDNNFDLLGYACDATGIYLDWNDFAYQVIDINALNEFSQNVIMREDLSSTVIKTIAGVDFASWQSKFSNKFKVTIPGTEKSVFSGTFSSDNIYENIMTNKYSYATSDVKAYKKHIAIDKYTDITTLKNFLTNQFKYDLNTLSYQQIIDKYGTHVYTDIYLGGMIRCNYKSYIKTSKSDNTVKSLVDLKLTNTLNLSNDSEIQDVSTTEVTNQSYFFVSIGGKGGLTGAYDEKTLVPQGIGSWLSTLDGSYPASLMLIDIGDNSLVPLYEFVDDQIKKEGLKTAIIDYMLRKKVTVLETLPLVKFDYSIFSQWMAGYNRWKSTSLKLAMPYESFNQSNYCGHAFRNNPNLPNVVPLYEKKEKNYYLYSTSPISNIIVCYIYNTNSGNSYINNEDVNSLFYSQKKSGNFFIGYLYENLYGVNNWLTGYNNSTVGYTIN